LESSIINSKFDSLPQELVLEVLKFLDSPSLSNVAATCNHFRVLITSCNLWRNLYNRIWGEVRGRVALRYSGDDDPTSFFCSFREWKELYLERQYIEAAWEAPERRALSFTVIKAHARSVLSMTLLPPRHRLVTGSQDRLVRVWDVTSGACLFKLQGPASCVAVDTWSDTQVKIGYKNGVVRVYDVMYNECTNELSTGETMRGCIFSKNSFISWYEHATHWDETTNQAIGTFTGHLQRVKSCTLCPTKSILYTASRDSTVRLWDLHNQSKITSINGHARAVNAIELINPNMCITGSSDKVVKTWDLRNLSAPVHVLSGHHAGKLKCIKYNAIGTKICTGGEDGVNVWRDIGASFEHLRTDFDGECVASIVMDEESVAYGGINGQIQYYDFAPHR
jgi:WD40 repeat protein